jgi:hypothetical protein
VEDHPFPDSTSLVYADIGIDEGIVPDDRIIADENTGKESYSIADLSMITDIYEGIDADLFPQLGLRADPGPLVNSPWFVGSMDVNLQDPEASV